MFLKLSTVSEGLFFEDDFRLFCGDLGNEVNDESLSRAFQKYPSFQKAKVVRDKKNGKTKGYGFVSFKDADDFIKAMREMNGQLTRFCFGDNLFRHTIFSS